MLFSKNRVTVLPALCVVFLLSCLPAWAETEAEQLARARQLMAAKAYSEAITVLTPLITSAEPTALAAKKALQDCYRKTGQLAKALPLLESILRDYIEPAQSYWQAQLGSCCRASGDFEAARAALVADADSHSLELAAIRALNERVWCGFAARDEWGEAVEFYKSLLTKWPERGAEWLYPTALAYRRMGMRAEAIASLEKALEQAQGDFAAIKRIGPELAEAYRNSDQPAKAAALLTTLEQQYSGYADYRRALEAAVAEKELARQAMRDLIYEGYAAKAGERWEQAITLFQDFIDRYPDATSRVESAHICIAECLQRMGKPDQAIAHLQELYDQSPDLRACALYGQATIYFVDCQYAQAVSPLERLLADHPASEYAKLKGKDLLAESHLRAGNVDQGVAVLRALCAESDKEAKTILLYRIGEASFKAERWQAAVDAYDELVALGAVPGIDGTARYRGALCLDKLGQRDQARTRMEQLAAKYPGSMWAEKANDWLASPGGAQ